ncbi:hypothetical protein [Amorphus sp. 3PC139-8]|uniref:hypothetical protein n=1 Tax=Amorphus sp. 3PC139-8 TaxID=2735676 RepID=UPI00345D3C03
MTDRPSLRPVRLSSAGHLADGTISLGFWPDDGGDPLIKIRLPRRDAQLLRDVLLKMVPETDARPSPVGDGPDDHDCGEDICVCRDPA